MGAEFFDDYIDKDKVENKNEAFSKLKSKAQYDYGHSGYSGSLAEKDGWTWIRVPSHVQTDEQFEKWMYDTAEKRSKWDDAFMTEYNSQYVIFGYASS